MPDKFNQGQSVLLVTRNFPPLVGGMEKLNQRLQMALTKEWQVVMCGPEGSADYVTVGVEVAETRVKPLFRFLSGTFWKSLRLAWKHRPEWVIAGSGLTAPIAWTAARVFGAKLAVYLHGLDIIAPSSIYQWLWLPFIRASNLVIVNSRNTAALAESKGVRATRLHILHPGTEIPELDPNLAHAFRTRHALADRPVMLSVGRLTRRKGLVEFVQNSLPLILARSPEAVLLVIGEDAANALHKQVGSEQERIISMARSAGVDTALRFIGYCNEVDLGAAYQAAQVHVFPVLELTGDVEGFGMVALESAAHGLKTVAFAVGGVPDAVEEPASGALVAPEDYRRFADEVLAELTAVKDLDYLADCRRFAAAKEWSEFGKQLRFLLREAT
jgi:phosphatidyl-myo-inositol dimannoside synthase